ncbi:MAG: chemotaxis-specific protein-glutamate methyltransferase CheB [Fuerstiella sp.]
MDNKKKARVLVVDDSALIREITRESDTLKLAGTAEDGRAALSQIELLRPDVVTLDIQMPRMDGLETLDEILKRDPIPVIMVSALAKRAADVTLQALDRGALDYVAKPDNVGTDLEELRSQLLRKIRTAASTDVKRVLSIRKARQARRATARKEVRDTKTEADNGSQEYTNCCITIGISTGGPPALTGFLETLRPPMPPIVIVQHMPQHFTAPFAERLNSVSQLDVKEAAHGDVLKVSQVFVAQGGTHLKLKRIGKSVRVQVRAGGDPVSGHMPSADVMMQCAADVFGERSLGVIMTGMGREGADGCGHIKTAGGYVLGQNQATSDVYGMNKVAFQEGYVDRQFPLDDAAKMSDCRCGECFAPARLPFAETDVHRCSMTRCCERCHCPTGTGRCQYWRRFRQAVAGKRDMPVRSAGHS